MRKPDRSGVFPTFDKNEFKGGTSDLAIETLNLLEAVPNDEGGIFLELEAGMTFQVVINKDGYISEVWTAK